MAYSKSGVNGTSATKGLNDYEQRVLSIISDATIDGDGATRECGRPINTVGICEIETKMTLQFLFSLFTYFFSRKKRCYSRGQGHTNVFNISR